MEARPEDRPIRGDLELQSTVGGASYAGGPRWEVSTVDALIGWLLLARFWRAVVWLVAWVFVGCLPGALPHNWGWTALVAFAVFAVWMRRRRLVAVAERAAHVRRAELQRMQLQAEMTARALFNEHDRRFGVAQGWGSGRGSLGLADGCLDHSDFSSWGSV